MQLRLAQHFKSTCSYCGVGCGIEVRKGCDGELSLRGDPHHPANRGALCAKGQSLLHTVRARDSRLHFPVMRQSKGAPRERTRWEDAIGAVARKFQQVIRDHGPDAVAFYISGQCLTEEYYLVNKIAKGFLKTNNIDTNSRLCMSSAVAGYKATLGADAPPVTYDDIELADTFLIAGANPAWCHPILFQRIQARRAASHGVRIIAVDPRRTATAASADLHLQLIPGTDVPLFLGIAQRLASTNAIDPTFLADHTEGAEAFLQSIEPWNLARTAAATGVDEKDIAHGADLLAGDRKFLSMWTMGLNQSAMGTDKNIALISLSLITGKIGRPGCGPFSLTGQPNAMGGREVGGMSNLLPAHRALADPEHREEVARFWDVDLLPDKPGLTAVELFDAIDHGKVKIVWIIATNPVASLPNSSQVERALAKAELVIAQDIYPNETVDFADVVLPAAGWLEKTGTMTSSDRRISLLEKAVEPPGEALPDAEILLRFARAMGWGRHFGYTSPAEIFTEHTLLTAGTDIDITGLSYEVLRAHGTVQWPAPMRAETSDTGHAGTFRLYTDHMFRTPSGRARLHAISFECRSEGTSPQFPLIVTTGRIRDQWHTMTKTGQVNRLSTHIKSPYCEIHPGDAAARNIQDGDMVTVLNERGKVRVRAVVSADIREGVLFLPMHWGKKLGGENGRANNLTSPRLDPASKEPDLKFAAAQAEKYIPEKRRIVIVGAGAAALAFIEAHRKFNPADEILLLGAEDLPVYNRVLLPHYIDGSATWDAVVRADPDSLLPHRVRFHPNTVVCRIDKELRTVTDTRGRSFAYDTLILATGSRPAVHYDGPIPEKGTYTLRTKRDADAILKAASAGKHAVIQGGGLLGLELADALRTIGCRVTILQRSDRLMGKQLDETSSRYLAEEVQNRGIHHLFHTVPTEIREGSVRVMTMDGGASGTTESVLPSDLFIFATGIVPNKEIAGTAYLDCDRGILINQHLQTSDPHIFAIGECAELDSQTFGTTAAAQEQARALAEYLRGTEHAPYKPTVSANILKIHGLQLASAGCTDPDPADPEIETVLLNDHRKRYFQKLVLKRDRLIGAICMGDTAEFSRYLEWISSGWELDEDRETLLRPSAVGRPALDGPLVCSCHHVGRHTIEKAAGGKDSAGEGAVNGGVSDDLPSHCRGLVERVCEMTKAGTGCGVCRPEIMQIVHAFSRG
ncbi:MAG: molybdopterin-dependent oxidoreductase [Phycisphaerae bacterium]